MALYSKTKTKTLKRMAFVLTGLVLLVLTAHSVLAGREHDDVEGKECEAGQHTNNPHCISPTPTQAYCDLTPSINPLTPSTDPTFSPTPTLQLTLQPTEPTLQLTQTPLYSVSPTETRPTGTVEPTQSHVDLPKPTQSWEEEKVIYFPGEGGVLYGPQK